MSLAGVHLAACVGVEAGGTSGAGSARGVGTAGDVASVVVGAGDLCSALSQVVAVVVPDLTNI